MTQQQTPEPKTAATPSPDAVRRKAFVRGYCNPLGHIPALHTETDIDACVTEAEALQFLVDRGFAFTRPALQGVAA